MHVPCVHRYAGVVEVSSIICFKKPNRFTEGVAVLMNQDLQMLRFFEAFSESAPQLILMMCRMLQSGEPELNTGLSQIQNTLNLCFFQIRVLIVLTYKATMKSNLTDHIFFYRILAYLFILRLLIQLIMDCYWPNYIQLF